MFESVIHIQPHENRCLIWKSHSRNRMLKGRKMQVFHIYALTAVLIFSMGVLGLVAHAHLLRKIVALNVMAGGTFLFFISIANLNPEAVDPVPQAMVLTGIVVAISATAFALCLVRLIYEKTGTAELDDAGNCEE